MCIGALLASIMVAMAFIGLWAGDGSGGSPGTEGGVSVGDDTFGAGQDEVISSIGALTLAMLAFVLLLKFVAPDSDDLP